LYIREIAPTGELLDVFLSDARDPASRVTYSALRALIVSGDSGPKLIMFDGMAQSMDRVSSRLTVTRFADVTYDLAGFMAVSGPRGRSTEELPTRDLLRADPALAAELGTTRAVLLQEGHSRLSNPLLGLAAPLIGFAALLVGAFSRFGLWRQVIGAVILLVVVQFADNIGAQTVLRDPALWPVQYFSALLGLGVTVALLAAAARPHFPSRRMAKPLGSSA
jgi:lipopolysaccharide export system permease protein